jgi:hypothetical protein
LRSDPEFCPGSSLLYPNGVASRTAPALVAELTALMEQLVTAGRSTPGAAQPNDVPVNWQRFMQPGDQPQQPGRKKAKNQPAPSSKRTAAQYQLPTLVPLPVR